MTICSYAANSKMRTIKCNHPYLEVDKGKGVQQDWIRCLICGDWIASYHFQSSGEKVNES